MDSSEIWRGWQGRKSEISESALLTATVQIEDLERGTSWRGRNSPVHKAQPVYTVSINVFSTREKSTTPSKNTSIVTAMDSQ